MGSDKLTAALAEYSSLRQEIIARLGYQTTGVFGSLTLLGIVIGAAAKYETVFREYPWVLPGLALIHFMIAWFLLGQDRQIAEIGGYINTQWRNNVISYFGDDSRGLFSWDGYIHQKEFSVNVLASFIRACSLYGQCYLPGLVYLIIYSFIAAQRRAISILEVIILLLNFVVLLGGIYCMKVAFEAYKAISTIKRT